MDMVVPGKRRRGRSRLRWTDNNREDMTKYELTADMTENRQYWKMMVKDWPTKIWRSSLKVRKVRDRGREGESEGGERVGERVGEESERERGRDLGRD